MQTASGNGVVICITADDPLIELELEPRLKSLGGYFDYGRNREILEIPLRSFLKLVDALLGVEGDGTFVALLDKALEDKSAYAGFEGELDGRKWAGKSEADKAIDFLQFLVETFAEKPAKLLAYLKPILQSQKHQRAEVDK